MSQIMDDMFTAMPSMKQFFHLFPLIRSYANTAEKRFKGIIFDLDDTLAPEASFACSGFKAVSQYLADTTGLNSENIFNVVNSLFIEGERRHIFDRTLEILNLPTHAAKVEKLVDIYRSHEPDRTYLPYPDSEPVLWLFSSLLFCGLITDGSAVTQRKKLDFLGLSEYFDDIIINEDLRFFKPDRASYLSMTARWGIEPSSIIVIGDNSSKDFITPREMGMVAVKIKRGGFYDGRVGQTCERPHYTVSNMQGFLKIVLTLEGLASFTIGKDLCQG